MKSFLVTVAFLIVGVMLVTTFILGGTGSDTMQGEGTRIGNSMVDKMQTITP